MFFTNRTSDGTAFLKGSEETTQIVNARAVRGSRPDLRVGSGSVQNLTGRIGSDRGGSRGFKSRG